MTVHDLVLAVLAHDVMIVVTFVSHYLSMKQHVCFDLLSTELVILSVSETEVSTIDAHHNYDYTAFLCH